jgi:hypothetical protein
MEISIDELDLCYRLRFNWDDVLNLPVQSPKSSAPLHSNIVGVGLILLTAYLYKIQLQ